MQHPTSTSFAHQPGAGGSTTADFTTLGPRLGDVGTLALLGAGVMFIVGAVISVVLDFAIFSSVTSAVEGLLSREARARRRHRKILLRRTAVYLGAVSMMAGCVLLSWVTDSTPPQPDTRNLGMGTLVLFLVASACFVGWWVEPPREEP